MWIARDRNGLLKLFSHKPKRLKTEGFFMSVMPYHKSMAISKLLFPDVTWENSPVRVKLICDNDE